MGLEIRKRPVPMDALAEKEDQDRTPKPDSTSEVEASASAERAASRRQLLNLIERIDITEQMRRRSVQQAISEAESWYWAWRAEQFHAVGTPSCDEAALNCLRHAELLAEIEVEL